MGFSNKLLNLIGNVLQKGILLLLSKLKKI